MPGVPNLPLSRGPECLSKFSWMMGDNLSEGSDLGFVGTRVVKEKGLIGANGWALLTYCFYHSRQNSL